jgi:hypothetical protein
VRRRVVALVGVLAAGAAPTGCGGGGGGAQLQQRAQPAVTTPAPALGPAIDLHDARWSLELDDDVTVLGLAARSGRRADHRVPPRLLRGRRDADLVRAAIAEIWIDVDPGGRSLRTLNASQRAVYALAWADEDLANGGFSMLEGDNAAAPLLRNLHATALRVGAPAPVAGLFAEAHAWRDKAQVAGDWVPFDKRYATLRRHRDTSLAHVLAAYIARHRSAFATGP